MKAAALVALFGGITTPATFVGRAGHGVGATYVPFHASAQAGDLAVIIFFRKRTLVGATAAGWTTYMFGETRVSWRVLVSGDLSPGALSASADTPVATMVWRGPLTLSPPRTSLSSSGASAYALPGFVKSGDCMGIVGMADCYTDAPTFSAVDGWTNTQQAPSLSLGFGLGEITPPSLYMDNAPLVVRGMSGGGAFNAQVCELLF